MPWITETLWNSSVDIIRPAGPCRICERAAGRVDTGDSATRGTGSPGESGVASRVDRLMTAPGG